MYLSSAKYYDGDTKDICILKATAGRSRSDNMDYYAREAEVMAERKKWFINRGSGWEPE